MLKSNKQKFYFIILPVLIITLVIIGLVVFKSKTTNNNSGDTIINSKSVALNKEAYQAKARDLFSRLSINDPASASQVKQELLSLKINKDFKDVHFRLVTICTALEKYSTTHDKTALNNLKNDLAKLTNDYPWLIKAS